MSKLNEKDVGKREKEGGNKKEKRLKENVMKEEKVEKLYSDVMKLSDFVKNHSESLPHIICTITGHYGNNMLEDMSANQILYARAVESEKRMMARRGDGRFISFPLNFQTPFSFLDDKNKVVKEADVGTLMLQSLHMDNQKVLLAGKSGSVFNVGGVQMTADKVGVMEVLKSYKDQYLIVHRIIHTEFTDHIDPKPLAIPTYLNLSLRIIYGQDGVSSSNWVKQIRSFENELTRLGDASPEELKNICIYDSTDLTIHPTLVAVYKPKKSFKININNDNNDNNNNNKNNKNNDYNNNNKNNDMGIVNSFDKEDSNKITNVNNKNNTKNDIIINNTDTRRGNTIVNVASNVDVDARDINIEKNISTNPNLSKKHNAIDNNKLIKDTNVKIENTNITVQKENIEYDTNINEQSAMRKKYDITSKSNKATVDNTADTNHNKATIINDKNRTDQIKFEIEDNIKDSKRSNPKVVFSKDSSNVSYKNNIKPEYIVENEDNNKTGINVKPDDINITESNRRLDMKYSENDGSTNIINPKSESSEYRRKAYDIDENNNEVKYEVEGDDDGGFLKGENIEMNELSSRGYKGQSEINKQQNQHQQRLHQPQQQKSKSQQQSQRQPQQQKQQQQHQRNLKYTEQEERDANVSVVPSGELMFNGKQLSSINKNNNTDVVSVNNNSYKNEDLRVNKNIYNNDVVMINNNKHNNETHHNSNYHNKYTPHNNLVDNNDGIYINHQKHNSYSPTNIQPSNNYNVDYVDNTNPVYRNNNIDDTNTNPLYRDNNVIQQQPRDHQSLPGVVVADGGRIQKRVSENMDIKNNGENPHLENNFRENIKSRQTRTSDRKSYVVDDSREERRSKSLQRRSFNEESDKESPRFKKRHQYIPPDHTKNYENLHFEPRNRNTKSSSLLLSDDTYLESPKQRNISYSVTDTIISFNSKQKLNNKKHLPDITYRATNIDTDSVDDALYTKARSLVNPHEYDSPVSSNRNPKLHSPSFKDKFYKQRKEERYEPKYEQQTNSHQHHDQLQQSLSHQWSSQPHLLPPLHLEIPPQQQHKHAHPSIQHELPKKDRSSNVVFDNNDNKYDIKHNNNNDNKYDIKQDSNSTLPLKKWTDKPEKKPAKQNKIFLMDLYGNLTSTTAPSRYITRNEDHAIVREDNKQYNTSYHKNINYNNPNNLPQNYNNLPPLHNSHNNLPSNNNHHNRYTTGDHYVNLNRSSQQQIQDRSSLNLEYPFNTQSKQQQQRQKLKQQQQHSNIRHLSDIPAYNSKEYDSYIKNNKRYSDNTNNYTSDSSYDLKTNPYRYCNNKYRNSRTYSNGNEIYHNIDEVYRNRSSNNNNNNNEIYRNNNYKKNNNDDNYRKYQSSVVVSTSALRNYH